MKKLCEECTFNGLFEKHKCCEDSEEQFELKVLIAEMIMDKCVDCDYWKNPLPFWNEDLCKFNCINN